MTKSLCGNKAKNNFIETISTDAQGKHKEYIYEFALRVERHHIAQSFWMLLQCFAVLMRCLRGQRSNRRNIKPKMFPFITQQVQR